MQQQQQQIITPEYIDPPISVNGPYSLREKTGIRYKVWPDKLNGLALEKGFSYEITFKTQPDRKGNTEGIISAIKGAGRANPPAQQPAPNGHADRNEIITKLALAKMFEPIKLNTAEIMAEQGGMILAAVDIMFTRHFGNGQ